MDVRRIYVNFSDRDSAGRVRIHAVFQPMGALPEAHMSPGQPVLLDDERGRTSEGILDFNDATGDWLALSKERFELS